MIKKEEVEHISKLARVGLSEEEKEKMAKELSLILDYFEKIKEVDVSGVEPTSHTVEIKNVKREDKASKPSIENSKELLKGAPDKKGRYIKVKAVLK